MIGITGAILLGVAGSALACALYTRLKEDEAFENGVRWDIYNYIKQNPGTHHNALKERLRLNNSTARHHLRMLQMFGYIKSSRDGMYLRFYPAS